MFILNMSTVWNGDHGGLFHMYEILGLMLPPLIIKLYNLVADWLLSMSKAPGSVPRTAIILMCMHMLSMVVGKSPDEGLVLFSR